MENKNICKQLSFPMTKAALATALFLSMSSVALACTKSEPYQQLKRKFQYCKHLDDGHSSYKEFCEFILEPPSGKKRHSKCSRGHARLAARALAYHALKNKDFPAAERYSDNLRQLGWNGTRSYVLGRIALFKRDLEQAIPLFSRAIRSDVKQARYWRGEAYFWGKEYAFAIKDFKASIKRKQLVNASRLMQAAALIRTKKFVEAEAVLATLLKKEKPKRSIALQMLGVALFFQDGKIDAAIESLNASIKENPNRGWSYVWLGRAYKEKGDLAQARDEFQVGVATPEVDYLIADGEESSQIAANELNSLKTGVNLLTDGDGSNRVAAMSQPLLPYTKVKPPDTNIAIHNAEPPGMLKYFPEQLPKADIITINSQTDTQNLQLTRTAQGEGSFFRSWGLWVLMIGALIGGYTFQSFREGQHN